MLRCTLADDDRCRELEIPQWMLDRASCCAMRSVEAPIVDCPALRALVELLGNVAGENRGIGPQTDQCSRPVREGETDEKQSDTKSVHRAKPIHEPAGDSGLEDDASREQNGSQRTHSPHASRSSRGTRRGKPATGGKR